MKERFEDIFWIFVALGLVVAYFVTFFGLLLHWGVAIP